MDLLENYYGKRNFTLYSLFMAVPGTNAFYRKLFVTFSIFMLSFSTMFQVLKFVSDGFTLEIIVELLPTTATAFGSLLYILYLTFTIEGKLERILSVIQKDLRKERSAEENEIKRQFAFNARLFTNFYTAVLIMTACGMSLAGFLPHFFDIIMSANNTRDVELLFNGEIFIDQKKCFYGIYFIECCAGVVVGILVIISENIAIIIGQHSCGMLAVLGYQLENITEIREEEISEKTSYVELFRRRLEMCIKAHQTSLQTLFIASEFYDIPLTIILATTFCTLSMSLVQITSPQLVSMKIAIFTGSQFCQLFIVSYMGQIIIDASLRVAQSAYNAKWTNCPTSVQRSLQMVILKSSKPCTILARSIYVLSIENCMSVVQTIMSFYMVIRQSN